MALRKKKNRLDIKAWAETRYFQLAVLNIFLLFLVLLKSAGYFYPYFPITINLIVVLGLLASIFLLKIDSRMTFVLAIVFWLFAALFKVLSIIPWAERMAIYSYEAFVIGIAQLFFENFKRRKNV